MWHGRCCILSSWIHLKSRQAKSTIVFLLHFYNYAGAVTRNLRLPCNLLTTRLEAVVPWYWQQTVPPKEAISEDFKHLCNSQKGYHHHLKKLLVKANELIERHHNTDMHRLRCYLFHHYFGLLITDEEELIDDICKAEEIKESLATTIAWILRTFKSTPVSDQSSLPSDKNPQSPEVEPQTPPHQVHIQHTVQYAPASDEPQHTIQEGSAPSQLPETRTVAHPNPSQNVTRLPKFSIPLFSGNTLQWQLFRDCFEAAVQNNPSITGVQKLNYLIPTCKP